MCDIRKIEGLLGAILSESGAGLLEAVRTCCWWYPKQAVRRCTGTRLLGLG